jgi:hypothetical protein
MPARDDCHGRAPCPATGEGRQCALLVSYRQSACDAYQAIRLYVQHIKTRFQVKPRWPRRGKIPLNFPVRADLAAGAAGVAPDMALNGPGC